ncbi:hypothetical protein GCM10027563_13630 [Parasphingorhabdus pacifica]
MLRRAILASVATVSALVLSACGQATEDSPGQSSSPEKTTQPTKAADPALKVTNPKDVSALQDPCAALTQGQLADLGATAEPTTDETPWGETACSWSGDNVSIDFSPDSVSGGGFSRIRENQDEFANYEETNVAGYPAARINSSELLCGIAAGVSDEHTVLINVTKFGSDASQHADPCAFAEKVFTESVKNIPAEG